MSDLLRPKPKGRVDRLAPVPLWSLVWWNNVGVTIKNTIWSTALAYLVVQMARHVGWEAWVWLLGGKVGP